jgi:superfamily I DNA/RNA helicase
MEPTDEQQDAIGMFFSGVDMAIEAGAGTGKTSTLQLIAEDCPNQSGQYVVFNRAAANDAVRRMPASVGCSTIHSCAARATDRVFVNRAVESRRHPSWQTAQHLGIAKGVQLTVESQRRILSSSWLAGHVMRALREFTFSQDPVPGPEHFPIVPALDVDIRFPNNRELADLLHPHLLKAWDDMLNPTGQLRYTHDAYVKAWALGDPQLPVDFLLVDEAQDLSPVHIGVFAAQDCQVIWVGDSCQQIYEWRGAINALERIPTDCRTYLTRSFRFGPDIAAAANVVLDRLPTEMRLTGDPGRASRLDSLRQPRAVLTRTNAVGVERVLNYQARGVPVHLVGGGVEVIAFARAAERLKDTGSCDHPEIGCFASWRAVQEYVAEDPLGSELRLLVDLVDKFGTDTIIEALDDMIQEDRADVVVSTAHKAKGREWDTVQLASDFPDLAACEPEDWRLLYVSITRARDVIDPYPTEVWRTLGGVLRRDTRVPTA